MLRPSRLDLPVLTFSRRCASDRQRFAWLPLGIGVSLVASLLLTPPADATGPVVAGMAPGCSTPAAPDGHEPPCNPYLADSPWAGNHRGSYAQASSPFPGPVGPASSVDVRHLALTAVPVIVSFSPAYPDGKSVLWASTVGVTGEVAKVDPDTGDLIDKYQPQLEAGAALTLPSVSGAYNVVDAEGRLHVTTTTGINVYGDARPGVRNSPIALLRSFELPAAALCGKDSLVGLTMTYDGRIAFATENGVVGTVPRDPAQMDAAHLRTISLNGADCSAGPDGAMETVSNSIAADDQGGIYVVTSHAQYRLDEDPSLEVTWRSGYAGAGGTGGGRLGAGSGSTPTLMGTAADDDRFVVITDGQKRMHLDLMWRDQIPDDWEPVRPGADRRIACEIPVTFGKEAEPSLSEQSVLVRGNSAVVVNNLQGLDPVLSALPPQLSLYTQLISGIPGNAPRGLERIAWDPVTRTCDVVWSNPDIAIPNGIPTMSVATGLIYGIGARQGVWTLEGIDWETGRVKLTVPTTALPTSNSVYAATTVGPDGSVWTGTFGGLTKFQPCGTAGSTSCRHLGPLEAVIGRPPKTVEGLATYLFGIRR